MFVRMESKQTYYILRISYNNSEISVDLSYNSTNSLPAYKHN